jgi:nucleotide-binding universal stress UspA family protein
MKKISHILSAVDFSYSAAHALERAGLIAREQEARLLIFHMMSATLQNSWPRGFDPLLANIGNNLKQELQTRLDELVDQQKHFGTQNVSALIAEGKGLDALLDEVKKNKTDLVVAGAHGTGYWHELFLGSFITKLIAHNPVPTLVVKDATPSTYKKVLIPVDFSASTTSLIEAGKAIAPKAQKILMHVVHTPHEGLMRLKKASQEQIQQYRQACIDQAQSKLDGWITSTQDDTFTGVVVEQGYPPGEITTFQRENGCDLVIIGKHGAGYLSDLLVGSVTKLVMSNTSCDTLVTFNQ